MTREVVTVLGGLVGLVIALTLISGGKISLGTSPAGPNFNLGFSGPQFRG